MSSFQHDVQGHFAYLPYDFRRPTWRKAARRLFNPGGPMLSPKVFGWGYALNFAHPGSWVLLVTVALVAVAGRLLAG